MGLFRKKQEIESFQEETVHESKEFSREQICQAGNDVVDAIMVILSKINDNEIMEKIAKTTNNSKQLYGDCRMALRDIAMSSEEMENSIRTVLDSTKASSTEVNEGCSMVEEIAQSVSYVKDANTALAEKCEELNKQIGNTISLIQNINSIARQTNLLALNASIEAAKAGEAGKGFAVVADEIRNLAENTNMTATTIRTNIENLTSQMESVIEESNNNIQRLDKLYNSTVESGEAFRNIHLSTENNARSTEQLMERVEDSVEKIGHAENIIDKMEELEEINSVEIRNVGAEISNNVIRTSDLISFTMELKAVIEDLR